MKSIEQAQSDIVEQFVDLDDWMDRYAMIIDLGNELPPLPENLKTPDRLIEGCQSRVWLDAERNDDGALVFRADSDAIIVKGIIAMLVDVLSGHTPDEILGADLHFIHDIGLDEHLSPTRSNGLLAMLRQMKAYAAAYKAKRG
ncbi:MAG: SufE family protein [Muribaculaceae bacterium]|nr:SufE family protein [Muribaculaceae bacterium]